MQGQVKQRSKGSWSIILYLGRDPVTGKKRQRWVTYHGSKKAAQAELARLVHEVNTGSFVEPSKLTVKEYLEKWLSDYAAAKVGAKTLERYNGIIHQHLIPSLGAVPLVRLQPLHIQGAYSAALTRGARKDGRAGVLSKQTVLHHHRVLRLALKHAVRWQLVTRNVADAVEPPRPDAREVNGLDEARTASILTSAAGTRLQIPILLAISTGLRRGEILALRWQDLDLRAGMLTVRRSLQETKQKGLTFKEPKSRRGRRSISMPSLAVELLEAHRDNQSQAKGKLGDAYQDTDLVCACEDGSVWAPSAFTSAFRALLRRRKIKGVRFHDLRHAHASQLQRAGVQPRVISERLGHSRVAFTLDTYSHLLPGMDNDAAQKTDEGLRSSLERQRSRVN